MKITLSKLATALLIAAICPLSQAGVVTFENLGIASGGGTTLGSAVSGGFQFTSPSNHLHAINQSNGFADSGSTNLMIHDNGGNNPGNSVTMTQVGNAAFSLNSAMFAEGFSGFGAAQLHVLGMLAGGGSVTADFAFDGIFDSVGGLNDFQTFSFGSGWTNLASVTFSGVGGTANEHAFSVDNITVDEAGVAVPEPSVLALMAMGLAGLRLRKRKHA